MALIPIALASELAEFARLPTGTGTWTIGSDTEDTDPGNYTTLTLVVGGHSIPIRSPLVPDGNIFIGGGGANADHTGGVSMGYFNVSLGHSALEDMTTGFDNTAVGHDALQHTTTGYSNAGFGYAALRENTEGYHNTAVGRWAAVNNTTGIQNTALGHSAMSTNTTGSNNVGIGHEALLALDGGTHNVAIGVSAGASLTNGGTNILIGFEAGANLTSCTANILIGHNIDAPTATTSNFLSIGNLIFATGGFGTGTTVGAGSVGIGTATPGAELHVVGATYSEGTVTGTGGLVAGEDDRAETINVVLNAAAGQERAISFRSANSDRWIMRARSNAESGSNAGSDFQLLARADDGSAIGTPLQITRSNLNIIMTGRVRIGADAAPTAGAVLELESTTGALLVPSMTTAQRDAMTQNNRAIIYNSTTAKFQGRAGGSWVDFH